MVIDSSALLAMLLQEPEWRAFAIAIDRDPVRLVSSVTVVESSIVVLARIGPDGVDDLDLLLSRLQAELKPLRPTDVSVVRNAYVRFGKGRHPASLNFGDCFSYALAVTSGQPLLFKGNDFSQTDVEQVKWEQQ